MQNIKRSIGSLAALAVLGGLSLGVSPLAAASGAQITATGGDGTSVDSDGTQGSFTNSVEGKLTNSVEGTQDSDGDQDAHDMTKSEEAVPQDKAPHK